MPFYLSGTFGDRNQSWPLDSAVLSVGRSSRNALHIPDATVSKEHAEILVRDDGIYIRDLGSRNGTRVNGKDAGEPIRIHLGDRVEVGSFSLVVTDGEPTQRVRFSESSVMSSSMQLRVDAKLDQRVKSATQGSGSLVHLLAEAGRLLVLPRPLQETCDQILEIIEKAVPASRYVLLLKEEGGGLNQIAARHRGGRAGQPLALSRSIAKTVIEECTSVLTGDAALDSRFNMQQSIVAQSVHSAMAVPLFDNDKVLGLVYVDSQDVRITFGEENLEVLSLLSNMAAVKITNARLLEAEAARARIAQELATATRIQRALLIAAPPEVPGYEIEAFLETCFEVGGDLYDFYVRKDGSLVFLVGDVSGKGVGASLLMSSFLASARVLYDVSDDMGELATRLNAILHRHTEAMHFVTGIVGVLEPSTGTLRYVNAGHPSAALAAGGATRTLESTAPPFGILGDFNFVEERVEMAPGEILALFTDGIPEASRGEELFDDERLHAALHEMAVSDALSAIRQHILHRVHEFVQDEPRGDDITLLLIRRRA